MSIRRIVLLLLVTCFAGNAAAQKNAPRIRAYPPNPNYLAWGEVQIFPLGAADFHGWTPISRPGTVDFEAQIERLSGVIDRIGSPHVRGFMRAMPYDPMNHVHEPPVGEVLQPWVRLRDGRFDLERFAPAWEERLRRYLSLTEERGIIVSLELWDDWSITRGPGGAYDPGENIAWSGHPFNPKNNVNYGKQALPETTAVCGAPFYRTVREGNETVLRLQKLYADRLIGIASDYPHVLLNLSNESRADLEWSRFWAGYARARLPAGTLIGEMPSTNRRDGGGECDHRLSPRTLSTDALYEYVDVAQGVSRHEFPEPRDQAIGGGGRIGTYRRLMAEAGTSRPLVVSKDYTRDSDGGDLVLWSRFVGGAAAARFHRPGGDMSEDVVDFQHAAVERLGRFIAGVPFWKMHPAPYLIESLPEGAGANVLAEARDHMVVQLIGGREGEMVELATGKGTWTVRWIDPARGREIGHCEASADDARLRLRPPGDLDHRVLHLVQADAGAGAKVCE